MTDSRKAELEAALLSVLAQPTRLKILYFLEGGEKCACEITPKMQEDPSVISRHLVKMRDSGVLDSRKEGVSIYYWVREPRVFKILEIVDKILISAAQERVKMTDGVL